MGSGGSLLPAVIGSLIHTEQFRKPDLTEVTGFAQQAYSFNAGTEPKNAIDLFGASVASGKKRYSIDSEGNVHQFTNTNDGTWHWSGSTGDKTVPLKKNDIPNSVKKEFGLPGKWR